MTALELRAELFREINPILDNEGLMIKLLNFMKVIAPAKEDVNAMETDWASDFAGKWRDSRTTEEIINDIRESRTGKCRDIDL